MDRREPLPPVSHLWGVAAAGVAVSRAPGALGRLQARRPWLQRGPWCVAGRVGLWKDIFTVSMNEKFDLVYKQKMGKCDLTFDFYL